MPGDPITINELKVSEYPFKENKNTLKNKQVLLYTHFYNISWMYWDQTFKIYVIYLFHTSQISGKLESKLGQKLTTFPTLWAPAPTELQFSNNFFSFIYSQPGDKQNRACDFLLFKHIIRKNAGTVLCSSLLETCAKFKVDSLSRFCTGASQAFTT